VKIPTTHYTKTNICIAVVLMAATTILISCNNNGTGSNIPTETGQAATATKEKTDGDYASLVYPNNPQEAIARNKEDNSRFVNDKALHPNRNDERKLVQAAHKYRLYILTT
jgi:hypothetical protein